MIRSLVGALLLSCTLWISPVEAAVNEADSGLAVEPINESLRGKIATIELADGSLVKKAKRVVVEPHFTYWTERGNERKVATDQIVRISARSKSKGWIGLGVGAGIGLLTVAGGSDSDPAGDFVVSQSDADAMSAVALTLVGYGIDRAIPRKSKLVYDADSAEPVDPPRKKSKRS